MSEPAEAFGPRATWKVVDGKALYNGRSLAAWVPDIVDELAAALDPSRVILFGSVARGDDGPDSDIDLMVVLDSLDYGQRHEWIERAAHSVSFPGSAQIYVTDERECRRRRDVIGSMHYWPLREGRVVYERRSP